MKRLAAFLVKTRDFSTFAPCVQTFGDNACHPSLREGSGSADAEILPLRYAQGFGSCAQDDSHLVFTAVVHRCGDGEILPLRYAQGFGSCAQDDSLTRRDDSLDTTQVMSP